MKTIYSMVAAALLMVAGAASAAEPVSLAALATFESTASCSAAQLAADEMRETTAGCSCRAGIYCLPDYFCQMLGG